MKSPGFFPLTQWCLLRLALVLLCLLPARLAPGVEASPHPVDLRQPDGTKITLRVRGNEYYHWFEDLNGFTVVADAARQYVYAGQDGAGLLTPTALAVGKTDPAATGLSAGVKPSQAKMEEIEAAHEGPARGAAAFTGPPQGVSPQGTVKNLVILCKFADHTFGTHTRAEADYDTLFNAVGGHATLAPTGSVKDYYTEASYGTMNLQSTVVAWVTLPQTEAYYANGSSALSGTYPANAQGMVKDALNLADALVNFADFDQDNDGFVDSLSIIHSGYGAETGGGGGNWIWSHRWSLWQLPGGKWTSAETNANGVAVKVYDYHTEPALWGTSGTGIVRIGVICHETGHFFGLPDLYDTDSSSRGLGSWCLMANSWGFDGSQLRPPHFSAWCKAQLGWVTPMVVSSGTHTVPRVQTTPTIFKITDGFPTGEYLLIENRQPYGYDSLIPQGGLAIWHIDENKASNADEGYPGQSGWPANGKHYKIALLQADGLYQLEKNSGNGDAGDLYRGGGVTSLTPFTVPNTHRYQGGAVAASNNTISNISATGNTMTFTLNTFAAPLISSPTSAGGAPGTAFSYQITATSQPTGFGAAGLPAGLSVNTTTGLISGTPTVLGTFNVTLSATNSLGTGTATLSLTIAAPLTFADALDTTGLTWTTGGNGAWVTQTATTHDAVDAAQSGGIAHSQSSYVETTVAGPGTLTFWWKVSSEGGYDYLNFSLDGVVQSAVPGISGEVSWVQKTVAIPSGSHALRWTYAKDEIVVAGSDAAWLDQVAFTPSASAPEIVVEHPTGTSIANITTICLQGAMVGAISAPATFTIRNTGTTALTGLAVTKSGSYPGDFIVNTAGMSASLAPGASTTFTISCAPSAAGTRGAAIQIANNDADESPFHINLSSFGASLITNGSDTFGYKATNDTPYAFTDISSTGTVVLDNSSAGFASVPVGFGFNFYGTSYSTAHVSTAGLISFGSGVTNGFNANLATSDFGQPVIAALWDGWATSRTATDRVYYQTTGAAGSRVFTVQWHLNPSSGTGEVVAQAQLFEQTGVVRLNYADVVTQPAMSWGWAATIGIADTGGNTNGKVQQFSFNTASVIDNMSVVFTPGAAEPEIAVEQPAGVDLADEGAAVQVNGAVVGGSSSPNVFTIRNRGSAPLTGLAVTKDGVNAADFIVNTSGMAATLAPNASTTFSVSCAPGAAGARAAAIHIANNDTKESPFDIALATHAVAPVSLGPDAYGYTASNNVPYAFTDISATGTMVMNNDINSFSSVPVGFAYNFYGTAYSTAYISNKGLISFSSGITNGINANLLTASFGQPVIAALWDDWVTLKSATDCVYYQTTGAAGSRVFTVQWHLNPFVGTGEIIVQAQLFEQDGTVRLNYTDVVSAAGLSWGQSATVGIQDTGGNASGRVLQYSFNTPSVTDGLSLIFTTAPAPDIAVEQPAGTMLADGSASVHLGAARVGASSGPVTFTIKNLGGTLLAGLSVSKDGDKAADFILDTNGMAATLAPGASTTFTVDSIPGGPGARTAALHIASNDPDESPFDIALACAGVAPASLGPDPYGYTFTNNAAPAFTDISGTGTLVMDNDNASFSSVPMGFAFNFYGEVYSTAHISNTGLISFLYGVTTSANHSLVTTHFGQPVIAALWDNWVTSLGATDRVYYQTSGAAGSRIFTVQWHLSPSVGTGEVVVQAQLFEQTGAIRINYLDVVTVAAQSWGQSATIGIADYMSNTNGRVLQYSFNTLSVVNGMSLLFTSPQLPEIVVEHPAGKGLSDGGGAVILNGAAVGVASTPSVFTIRNAGFAPLTGLSITKDGVHAGEFTVDTTGMATTLASNAATTFTVRCTPGGLSLRNAAIHIASSDAGENPFDLALYSAGVALVTQGPDAFGYTVTNTAPYGFTDISATGTVVLDNDTANFAAVPVGFAFNFYGGAYTTAYVSTKGLITFTGGSANGTNADMTVTNFGQPVIAALWNDWVTNLGATDRVYCQTSGAVGSRVFTVQWHLNPAGVIGEVVAQAQLFEQTGVIRLNYMDVLTQSGQSWGESATIGIQDTGGNGRVLQHSFNIASVVDGMSVVFTPGPPKPEIVVEQPAGISLIDGVTVVSLNGAVTGKTSGITTFTIRNRGSATLTGLAVSKDGANAGDFTVNTAGMGTTLAPNASATFTAACVPTLAGTRVAALHITSNDADESPFDIPLNCLAVPLITQGPDAFGYTMTNDLAYAFTDISGAGAGTVVLDNEANWYANVPLGFNFKFYGASYNTVHVATTGLLTFTSGSTSGTNSDLTAINFGQPVIAALWDDWVTNRSATDRVYYQTTGAAGNRVFTVQWHLSPASNFGEVIVQAQLFELTGAVRINYVDVATLTGRSYGQSATVGIQNTGGGATGQMLQYSFNSPLVIEGMSLLFLALPPEIAVERPAGTSLVDGAAAIPLGNAPPGGTSASATVTVKNTGGQALTGLAVTVDGANAADFTINTAGLGASLASGASATFTVSCTPNATGLRAATLHIASNDADENPFDIALTATGLSILEQWRQTHFNTTANTGDAADTADPDHDGLSNLQEMSFGTLPTAGSRGAIILNGATIVQRGTPVMWRQATINGGDMRALFGRRKDYAAAGLTYTVQFSPDLAAWQDSTDVPTVVASDAETDGVTVPFPAALVGDGKKAFFRVQVSSP